MIHYHLSLYVTDFRDHLGRGRKRKGTRVSSRVGGDDSVFNCISIGRRRGVRLHGEVWLLKSHDVVRGLGQLGVQRKVLLEALRTRRGCQ